MSRSTSTAQPPLRRQSEKYRGGYYTPPRVADFLASWAIQTRSATILEPSAGDGGLVSAAAKYLKSLAQVTAVELLPEEAAKIQIRTGGEPTVHSGDFFKWFLREQPFATFDAVVGNPPFIRYQNFPEEHRQPAFSLMRNEGLHPTRLTNAWLPFVVASTLALKPGGRLALVLPAELLQVNYAAELRSYLARRFNHLTLITFRSLMFDGIQQETVLLLGERGDSEGGTISIADFDTADDIDERTPQQAQPRSSRSRPRK